MERPVRLEIAAEFDMSIFSTQDVPVSCVAQRELHFMSREHSLKPTTKKVIHRFQYYEVPMSPLGARDVFHSYRYFIVLPFILQLLSYTLSLHSSPTTVY
jgi:hypothetical protein